jgi:hypothetical protein
MSANLKSRRVNGGRGWADAIFRKEADSTTYSRLIFQRIIKRNNLECFGFEIQLLSKSFKIFKNKRVILIMNYKEVEHFRWIGVFTFEQFLEKEILRVI